MPADPKAKAAEKEGSVDKGKGKDKELPEDPKAAERELKDVDMEKSCRRIQRGQKRKRTLR